MTTDELVKKVEELEKTVEQLRIKRAFQWDLAPDCVKMRHMSEPNRYVNSGLDANRPTGVSVTSGVRAYFATDTGKFYIYNGTAWVSVTLS